MADLVNDMSNADPNLHTTFYNWIVGNKELWHLKGIEIEKIDDLRTNRPYTQVPFVSVYHRSSHGLGEILLYQVNQGYIIHFYAYSFSIESDFEPTLAYVHEFSINPKFDLWQEKYVAFLSKGKLFMEDCQWD